MNISENCPVDGNATAQFAFLAGAQFDGLLARLAGARVPRSLAQVPLIDDGAVTAKSVEPAASRTLEPDSRLESLSGSSHMKPKIIFIHGMFLNPKSWEHWIPHFEAMGYSCVAPAWPLHGGEPADLRAQQPPGLGELLLTDVYTHYQKIVGLESEPPIAIGHSMGGFLVQKLAADRLIRAGVGICPVAPNGMLAADWGFIRNSASIANPLAGDEPYPMTPDGFHRNFANTLSESDSRAAFDRYAMDESRQVLRDVLGDEGEIDTDLPHVPLLLIGAEKDEIIPGSLVRRNAHAYSDERSHSEFAEFSGRGHFICGEPGWEEVAEKITNWLDSHLQAERA